MFLPLLCLSIFGNDAYYPRVLFVEIGNALFGVIKQALVARMFLRLKKTGKVGVQFQDPLGVTMSEALSIHHDEIGHHFEIIIDGHRAYLTYMDLGKQTLDFYRTFVPDALRGRGIAAALTKQALDYADSIGYSVIPSCSYVERYMELHDLQSQAAKL